jgi:cation diffusion facilitator CzcD-associated flavoprotein CzcO
LSAARIPELSGLKRFAGAVFHTQAWSHEVSLSGKRVAVIGTGASAIQCIPEVAKVAQQLTVCQRTAPWVLPRNDLAFGEKMLSVLRWAPALVWLIRVFLYWLLELRVLSFVWFPSLLKRVERQGKAHLAAQVRSNSLREQLTPNYLPGCKRLLLSDDYYPVFNQDNVTLETAAIAHVTENGLRFSNGETKTFDVLVFATGFSPFGPYAPLSIVGRDNVSLTEHFNQGHSAYKGTVVHRFPNFFMLTGPNTGIGHTSLIFMIESQYAYVLSALKTMREKKLRSVEVKNDIVKQYTQWIHSTSAKTVWLSGCKSWYLDAFGQNRSLWPGFTFRFRRQTRRFDEAAYVVN